MKTFSQVVRNYWVDLILLNLAFLLGCIPVVTIPASLAALCSAVLRMQRAQDVHIFRDFFRDVRTRFLRIGHPVAPVIKISGNPMTVKSMRDNIDVDVSGVINQGLTLDQATDIVQDKLVDVCWGAMTSSDMLGEIETAASRLLRTL